MVEHVQIMLPNIYYLLYWLQEKDNNSKLLRTQILTSREKC